MQYKDTIKQIIELPWSEAKAKDLIIISCGTAFEFAESLRLGQELHPNDSHLEEMIDGELKTPNMVYEDYTDRGDHWEYLEFFIGKLNLQPSSDTVLVGIQKYTEAVRTMSSGDRAMTVFSREEELTAIFHQLIASHNWDKLGYGFYKHYLEAHIEFDSGENGHHHLTEHFPLHEPVLEEFYQIRLKLYSTLFQ